MGGRLAVERTKRNGVVAERGRSSPVQASRPERLHLPCRLKLDGTAGYVLWYSDETDGVITDAQGRPVIFPSVAAARRQAMCAQLALSAERPTTYDVDALIAWAAGADPDLIDPADFLKFWNLMTDVADSTRSEGLARRLAGLNKQYDKLFWGTTSRASRLLAATTSRRGARRKRGPWRACSWLPPANFAGPCGSDETKHDFGPNRCTWAAEAWRRRPTLFAHHLPRPPGIRRHSPERPGTRRKRAGAASAEIQAE